MELVKIIGDKLATPVTVLSGIVHKGAYAAGTDYAVGDVVSYNGASYVMYTDAGAGTAPTDTTKWQVLSSPQQYVQSIGELTLINATTDNTISVDQNGDVGTDVSTDGAIHIENTGNTGIGLGVYTNIGATASAPLVSIKVDNAAFDQGVVFIENDGIANGLYVKQNGILAATNRALYIELTSDLSGAQAGGAIVYSNVANTVVSNSLLQVWADNPASAAQALNVNQDGTGPAIYVDHDGVNAAINIDSGANGPHLRFTGSATVATPTDGDMWFNGSNLLFRLSGVTKTITWA